MSEPKDYSAFYPASRGRPLTDEEKETQRAQAEEAARQEAALREAYPASQPSGTGKATTYRDLYPRSVEQGMADGDLPGDGGDAA